MVYGRSIKVFCFSNNNKNSVCAYNEYKDCISSKNYYCSHTLTYIEIYRIHDPHVFKLRHIAYRRLQPTVPGGRLVRYRR